MYIITNNKKINVINANSFYKKLKGLMGIKNIQHGMFFKHTNSIHTFFMKDTIDVLGINNKDIIIYKKENVSKNKIIIIDHNFLDTNIIELPKNSISEYNLGEKLIIYK